MFAFQPARLSISVRHRVATTLVCQQLAVCVLPSSAVLCLWLWLLRIFGNKFLGRTMWKKMMLIGN